MHSLEDVVQALQKSKRVVVLSHYNPDPDAYGSSCALALALEGMGKQILLVNETGILPRWSFLAGVSRIVKTFSPSDFDTAITCDCGDAKRVGDSLVPLLKAVPCIVNIDHHVSNDCFGHINYVDPQASSTSEIVYRLLSLMGGPLASEVITNIYAGIVADTGGFRYSCTTEQTFSTVTELVRLGVRPDTVAEGLYGNNSLSGVRLQSEALAGLTLHCQGRLCELLITEEMVKRCQAASDDSEGLVEKGRDIEGVVVSFLMRWDNGIWRVSLRSKNQEHDLSAVAKCFGGGGHRSAAAFRWRKTFEELQPSLLAALQGLFA